MPSEPSRKRTIAFIDGQNLYHSAREVFGYPYPSYDIKKLVETICTQQGWDLEQIRFYTGVPSLADKPFWHHFWNGKLAHMGRQGIAIYSRELRYRNKMVRLPDGSKHAVLTGEEKGIDVRIAVDIISLMHRQEFDVALVFSQDQDLTEVADEIRFVAAEQKRWVKMASAFPIGPARPKQRGIDKTDWVSFDRTTYEACIDQRDYRPKKRTR